MADIAIYKVCTASSDGRYPVDSFIELSDPPSTSDVPFSIDWAASTDSLATATIDEDLYASSVAPYANALGIFPTADLPA